MPRGGSRKGEHRGNAKAQIERPKDIMRAAVKAAARPGKGRGARNLAKATIEHRIVVSRLIHGMRSADDLTPKEIMLENMHWFQQAAYEATSMLIQMVESPDPEDEESRQARNKAIRETEIEIERLRRMASDEAYKVAPMIHPRLQAIQMVGGGNATENVMQQILDHIDEANRSHQMVIEHIPGKRSA